MLMRHFFVVLGASSRPPFARSYDLFESALGFTLTLLTADNNSVFACVLIVTGSECPSSTPDWFGITK